MKRLFCLYVLIFGLISCSHTQIKLDYSTPKKAIYHQGDIIELDIRIKTRPETCQKGMKQVKTYLSGLKIEKMTDWRELSKGLWTAHINLSVVSTKNKSSKLTIIRRVDKEDLFRQELFTIE